MQSRVSQPPHALRGVVATDTPGVRCDLVLYSEYDTHISTPVSILMVITIIVQGGQRPARNCASRLAEHTVLPVPHGTVERFPVSEQIVRLDGEAQAKLKKLNREV